jgi:hypothetical protein
MKRLTYSSWGVCAGMVAALVAPKASWACACGCGVFDVATSSMFPTGQGGMVFLTYAYQDQNQNYLGASTAPAQANADKEIETHFFGVGLQYMFNNSWGIEAEIPYSYRHLRTLDAADNPVTLDWNQLGDMRLRGIYTGFSPDMSGGITFGVKLPTGSYSFRPDVVDRDSQIGTGSTDLLLGGFYRHPLPKLQSWDWFAQAELDVPTLTQAEYRPGLELDAAAGVYYSGLSLGPVRITPIAQVIGSERSSDRGAQASNPVASGYQRLMLAPGLEVDYNQFRFYADAEVPVYQHFNGYQLAAPVLFKVSFSFMF